ncbi:MAG: DUF4439 domain-containing protein [Aeromicrobium sp.]
MTAAEALQAWLALEHEAVWLYPVLGARFDDLLDRATASFEGHRDTRDALTTRLRALGVEPVGGRLAYDPGPLTTGAEARAAAQAVEVAIGAACLVLAGATEDRSRAYAIRNLTRSARAELTWGAAPRAFPGLP